MRCSQVQTRTRATSSHCKPERIAALAPAPRRAPCATQASAGRERCRLRLPRQSGLRARVAGGPQRAGKGGAEGRAGHRGGRLSECGVANAATRRRGGATEPASPLPLPAQVRKAADRAFVLFDAVSRAVAADRRHRSKVGRGTFLGQANLVAERQAVDRILKTGRGAFRSQVGVVAILAETRRRLLDRPTRRHGRWVNWVTEGPRLRRRHRATGQPSGRPKHDDRILRRAVAKLQSTFRLSRLEAENAVIATMLAADEPQITGRKLRSIRARLR